MSTSFVGRQAELALLARVCEGASNEEAPSAVLVSGPPGSGKSRLLSEFGIRHTNDRHLRVAGFEAGSQVPLAAAADLLRELGTVARAGAMLSEFLFRPPSPGQLSLEPLRVFEAARQSLLGLSGPVVLFVDDVQWIDELSVALCSYLVRSAVSEQKPLAVVAATRPSAEAMVFRDSLINELGVERVTFVELGPLDREDAVQLVRQVAPRWTAEQALDIWSQAKGSPFWLGMIARAGEGVDVVGYLAARQRGLGTDAGRVLGLLAVTTRPLAVTECAEVLAWDESRTELAVAELERSALAIRQGSSLGLAHDLIRVSVMDELADVRRRELHGALARWLERQAETDVQLLHESLIHRREAGMDMTDLALQVLESPRRRLLGRSGLRELAQIADSEGLAEPVAVALRLSVAQLASELGEQKVALDRWSALASEVSDPTLRATAYLAASRAAVHIVERRQDALELVDLADRQPTDDPALAVEIASHRANLLQVVGRNAEEGRRAAFNAAEKARELWGKPPVEMTVRERDAYVGALQVAFDAAVVEEDGVAELRLADELARVAHGSDEASVWADHDRASALMFAGRVGESLDFRRRAWTRARQRMLPMLVLISGSNLAGTLVEAARFDEAEEVISECLELERRVAGGGERFAMAKVGGYSLHSIRHEAWLSSGVWQEAIASLESEITRQQEPHYRMHLHWHVFVWLARCGDRDRTEEIDRHIDASRRDSRTADCRRCSRELRLRTAEAYARLGRLQEAESELRAWDEGGRPASVYDLMWRRHLAALVAVAEGDGAGVAELEAVLAQRTRLGLVASALWSRLDLAAALHTADSKRSAGEFRQAGELAAAAGASTEQHMAELGLRRLGVRTWRRGRAAGGENALARLSERERQIATLIGTGHSNPEIAGRLFLSRKTVERHVSNILARTGTRNRTELARFLSAEELSSRTR